MPAEQDRRKTQRIAGDEKLFVKIVASSHDESLPGTIASCSTDNLSADGLKIRIGNAAPVGCLLDLWIRVGSRPGTFLLSGEVKWSEPDPDSNHFTLGIALNQQPGDDFTAWQRLMSDDVPVSEV